MRRASAAEGRSFFGESESPVERVVPGLRRVVEELALGGSYHVLERLAPHRLLLQELVHGVDVLAMMLAVVKRECLGRDHRRERVLGIWQGRQFEM